MWKRSTPGAPTVGSSSSGKDFSLSGFFPSRKAKPGAGLADAPGKMLWTKVELSLALKSAGPLAAASPPGAPQEKAQTNATDIAVAEIVLSEQAGRTDALPRRASLGGTLIDTDAMPEDIPDQRARKFAVNHGVPPYIVPPDSIVSWTHTNSARGIEVCLQLDKPYSRAVEIWTVSYATQVSGVIYRDGEFGDIRGVSAAAAFLKGVRVRASKFACTSLDGRSQMTITAKPPMLPSFPVSVSTAYVLTRKGASLRWMPATSEARRSEDERIRRLSAKFCQMAASAA